jgi:hypothetical protein
VLQGDVGAADHAILLSPDARCAALVQTMTKGPGLLTFVLPVQHVTVPQITFMERHMMEGGEIGSRLLCASLSMHTIHMS